MFGKKFEGLFYRIVFNKFIINEKNIFTIASCGISGFMQ